MPSSTRSLSASGSGQARPAAARRSSVRATVLRAMPSDRAIARSLDRQACFRRRISRTRRIDTLSAGIGSPTRHWSVTNRSPLARPAIERPPPDGWPTPNRDGRHHVGTGGRLHLGIGGRLAPESAHRANWLRLSAGSRGRLTTHNYGPQTGRGLAFRGFGRAAQEGRLRVPTKSLATTG